MTQRVNNLGPLLHHSPGIKLGEMKEIAMNFSEFFYRRTVWNKASTVPGYDPNFVRRDDLGYIIQWEDYGDRSSRYGWEFDHIVPASRGGSDLLFNIRPLNWMANVTRGNKI